MRRAALVLIVFTATGCGGSADTHQAPVEPGSLGADGISIQLPDGWTGRILIGSSGRPVLHAASFPVEANDTDEGEIAREAIGVNGMYLNVRDVGAGAGTATVPVRFAPADFAAASACCHLREATADVAGDGERFRITAVSGGADPPPARYLDQLNAALDSLRLAAYRPAAVTPATGDAVDGFGLHVHVPDGWQGGIARGEIHGGDGALDLQISEYSSPDAASFVTGHLPLTIGPDEFVQPQGGSGYETGRTFLAAGREFQLWVRSPDANPPAAELARANALLASFHAEEGDFYPGNVDAATFAEAAGWYTGSTGPAAIQPDGEQTMSWASTIRYRDGGFQFPPHETLDALPPDGVVIVVSLEEHGQAHGDTASHPPFRLDDFVDGSFEGISPGNAAKHFDALLPDYTAGMWVLFGREHPTQEQLDCAQAELDRLKLPRWPAWDATSAAR